MIAGETPGGSGAKRSDAPSVAHAHRADRSGTAARRLPTAEARRLPVPSRALLVAAAVALVLALAAWFVLFGPARAGGAPGSLLADLRGDGDARSRTFHARPGWTVEWETTGSHFSYTIRGDRDFGQVVNQNGPGNGITSPVPTGDFWIQVAAEGPWSVRVVQGD